MKAFQSGLFLILVAVSISGLGCRPENADSPQGTGSAEPYRPTYTIGLIPEQNIFTQKEQYDLLLGQVQKKLGVKFQTRILPSYGSIFKEFSDNRISGAFLGSYLTVKVLKEFPTLLVAAPKYLDDLSTYTSLIITRKSSGITEDIGSWKGRSMALVHPYTSAGYLYPLCLLADAGVKDYAAYLSRVDMLGSHDAVFFAVIDGQNDLGAMKNTVFNRIIAEHSDYGEGIRILKESREFPTNALVVRKDLPADFIARLKDAFLTLHEDPEGRQVLEQIRMKQFVKIVPEDYKNVEDLLGKAKSLDIPTVGPEN